MRVKRSCPLGHECERVREDVEGLYLDRCHFWNEYRKADGGSDWGCSIVWGDVVTSETQGAIRGVQASIERTRNKFLRLAAGAEPTALIDDREVGDP